MKRVRITVVATMLAILMLCSSISIYAATYEYLNITRPEQSAIIPSGVTATDAIAFGQNENYLYILKHDNATNRTGIYVYYNLVLQSFIDLGIRDATEHPNGMAYYASNLYVVVNKNYIIKIKLNTNELTMNSKAKYYVTNMNNQQNTKAIIGIASMDDGAFIIKYKNSNYARVKFNVTNGTCVEKGVYSLTDTTNRYTGAEQDIGFKKDSSGSYIFLVTTNKLPAPNTHLTYQNKMVKYKINGSSLAWNKTIDLNKTGSQELYELEGVDFNANGRMYFGTNEKKYVNGVLKKDDWVRYYD